MKRKLTVVATSPSPSPVKRLKPHRGLDTRPLSPVRFNTPSPSLIAFELNPKSAGDPKSNHQSKPPPPLRARSLSLPNLSTLRSIPIVARLSKENLLAMSMDPRQPFTHVQSTVSSKSRSQFSPSKSSNLNPAQAAEKLSWANILDEDAGEEALALQPEFRERIKRIVDGGRTSNMKPDSVLKFRNMKKQMASRNEATIASRLMPFLVKEERGKGDDELEIRDLAISSDQATPRRLSQSFEIDGLDWNISAPFHSNSVPIPSRLSYSSQSSAELGLKNPTPDLTYGFKRSEFSSDELRLLSRTELEVAKEIVSPFFVVEWKAWRGNLLEAKVQARRAGAAMVWGRRKARNALQVAKAGSDIGVETPMDLDATTSTAAISINPRAQHKEISNFDTNAIVFSCVISPDVVFFYVHWAEDPPFSTDPVSDTSPAFPSSTHPLAATPPLSQCPKYHTALLAKHFLDAESVPKIRACMHNILDWGLEHRKAAVKTEAAALVHAEEEERTRAEIDERESKKRKI